MKTSESLQQVQDKPKQRPLSEEDTLAELTQTNQQLQEQLAETSRLLAQTQAELAELQQSQQLLRASQDITAREQVEKSLRESEALYQSSLDSLPQNVYRIDREGRIIFGNKAYLTTLGLTMKECYGKTAYDFYPQELADKYTADDRHVMQTGEILDVVESHQLPLTGETTYVHVIKAPTRDSSGEIIGLQAIFWDVTKRIRAEQTTLKRAAELETVAQVSTTISTILDLPQLLQNVVKLTQQHFNLYHCQIFMTDETGETLQVKASGWEEGDPHAGTTGNHLISINQEQSLVARAARTGRPVMVNEVQADPGWLPNPLLPQTRSELAVPIIKGEQLLGVLDVQSKELNHFIAEDEMVMTTLAAQVAGAIQNANQYQLTQTAFTQMTQLYDTSQIISQARNQMEVITALVNHTAQANLDRIIVALITNSLESEIQVEVKGVWDRKGQEQRFLGNRFTSAQFPILNRLRTEEVVLIDNCAATPQLDPVSKTTFQHLGVQSAAILPISTGQRPLGWLLLETTEGLVQFTSMEMRPYISLARQAAVALENQRLLQKSQTQAQREQLLRELTARIRGSADVDTVMRTAAREVGQALGRPAFVYLGTNPEEQQTPPFAGKEEASDER